MVAYSRPIPTELINAILSDLWLRGDLASLKACALVHQSWLPVAQRLIFRSVKFEQPIWTKFKNAMDSFVYAVEQNPSLTMHVRDISFNWQFEPIVNFLNRVTFPSVESFTAKRVSMIGVVGVDYTDCSSWPLLKLQSLTKIFLVEDTFDNMVQFSRCFDEVHGLNISTVQLHRVCILKVREEKVLAPYMYLDDEDVLQLSIFEKRQERVLAPNEDLNDKDLSQPSINSLTPRIRPKLQNLEIVRGHALTLASWFINEECPFDLTNLKTLKYEEDLEKPDITNLVKLLQICATSLESLEVYSPRIPLTTNDLNISTSTMPNLRHLTISGISAYSIVNAIPWLSQLTCESQLHTLVLKFSFGKLNLAANERRVFMWQDLDNAVDNLPTLNLERIEVKIPNRKQKKSVQEISKAYLPKVMERSICILTIL